MGTHEHRRDSMVKDSDSLQELINSAFELGVSDAGIIAAQLIVVEDRFCRNVLLTPMPGLWSGSQLPASCHETR
jgi:hypothetical protein